MSIFNFFNRNASKKEDINPGTTPNKQTENYSTLNTPPMDLFIDSNEPFKSSKTEAATGNRINQFLNRNFLTLGINDGFEYHSFDTFTKVKRKLLAEFQLIMDQEIQDKKERMLELRQLVIDVKDLSEAAKAKLELTIEELNSSLLLLQSQKELAALEEGWVMNAIHTYYQGFTQGLNDYIEGEQFLSAVKNF